MHPGRLIAALLLVAATAVASIDLVSPRPDVAYASGEEVIVAGNARADRQCSGDVVVTFDGAAIRNVSAAFAANAVVDLSVLLGPTSLTATPGNHSLRVYSTCLGDLEVLFEVSSRIDIIYELNADRLMTGDELSVRAYAFGKAPLYEITSIIIDDQAFNGSAVWRFGSPGQHSVVFRALDGLGNQGEKTVFVTVSDKLLVSASPDRPSYRPGEVLRLNISAEGAFGGARRADYLVYAFGRTYEQTQLVVPEKAMSGVHTLVVEARNGSNFGLAETTLRIEAIPNLTASAPARVEQGSPLDVTATLVDQSGLPLTSEVDVTVKKNGSVVYSAKVPANGLQSLELPELPPGNYVLLLEAMNKSAESALRVVPRPPQPAQAAATGLSLASFSTPLVGLVFLALAAAGWYFYENRKGPQLVNKF